MVRSIGAVGAVGRTASDRPRRHLSIGPDDPGHRSGRRRRNHAIGIRPSRRPWPIGRVQNRRTLILHLEPRRNGRSSGAARVRAVRAERRGPPRDGRPAHLAARSLHPSARAEAEPRRARRGRLRATRAPRGARLDGAERRTARQTRVLGAGRAKHSIHRSHCGGDCGGGSGGTAAAELQRAAAAPSTRAPSNAARKKSLYSFVHRVARWPGARREARRIYT